MFDSYVHWRQWQWGIFDARSHILISFIADYQIMYGGRLMVAQHELCDLHCFTAGSLKKGLVQRPLSSGLTGSLPEHVSSAQKLMSDPPVSIRAVTKHPGLAVIHELLVATGPVIQFHLFVCFLFCSFLSSICVYPRTDLYFLFCLQLRLPNSQKSYSQTWHYQCAYIFSLDETVEFRTS